MPNTNSIFYPSGKIAITPNVVQKSDSSFQQWNECNSTAGSSWQVASINARMLQCEVINRPNCNGGLVLDSCNDTNLQSMKAVSLDSLECLLSGSNSHTDTTSGDDDGISLIFSDSNNNSLWNFQSVPPSNTQSISHTGATQHNKRKAESQRKNLDFLRYNNPTVSEFQIKKPRMEKRSSDINFQQSNSSTSSVDEPDSEVIAQMKEMIYHTAAFRPVSFGVDPVEKPKRKNVKISSNPQTVAARQRRERISERIRVLQTLVPGGSKMDTASMLDEAANYLKFLRSQVKSLEAFCQKMNGNFPPINGFGNYSSLAMHQTQFSIIQNPKPTS